MDAETMAARHKAAVSRYARQVADDGYFPDGLLRELAAIADEHLRDERGADAWVPAGEPVVAREVVLPMGGPLNAAERPDAQSPAPAPVKPPASRTAAARRTRTRTR